MLAVALVVLLAAPPTELAPMTAPDAGKPRLPRKPQPPDAGSQAKSAPASPKPPPLSNLGTEPCGCPFGVPGWPGYLPPPRHLPDGGMGTEVDQSLEFLAGWRQRAVDTLKNCPRENRDAILEDSGRFECWQIQSFARPDEHAAADLADAKRFKVKDEVERLEKELREGEQKGRTFGLAFAISFGQVAHALESKAEFSCEYGGDPGPPPERLLPSCPHPRSFGFGVSTSPGPKVTATPKDPPEQQYKAAKWARRWEATQNNIAQENEWQLAELKEGGPGDAKAIEAARAKIKQLCGTVAWIRGMEKDDHTVSDAFLAQAKLFHGTLLWLDTTARDPVPCK